MRTPPASSETFQLFTVVVYLSRSAMSAGRVRTRIRSLVLSGRQRLKRDPVISAVPPAEAETSRAVAGSNSQVAGPAVTVTVLPVRTRTGAGAGRGASGTGPSTSSSTLRRVISE